MLVVLPRPGGAPSGALKAFLRAASRDWDLRLRFASSAAEEARCARLLGAGTPADGHDHALGSGVWAALSSRPFAAVVVVDAAETRPVIRELAGARARVPVVLVVLGPGSAGLRRPRRVDPQPVSSPTEVWCFSSSWDSRGTEDLVPLAVHRAATPDADWVTRRVRDLVRGAQRPAGRPKLASLVIPCWNGLRYTRACVDSVLRHTRTPFELIMVDNASTDRTARFVSSLRDPRVRLIRNPSNLGFAKAVNQGMSRAKGDYIVWLNNDTVVTPRWLDRLEAHAERAPWVGAVGPYTNSINGPQLYEGAPCATTRDLNRFAESLALRNAGRASSVHRLTGFCLLLKREAVERIGTLDEGFGLGCYEDFDYCMRLRQAGYALLLAEDAFVRHHGHKSFEGNGLAVNGAARANRELFIDKWCRLAMEFLDVIDPELSTSHGPSARK